MNMQDWKVILVEDTYDDQQVISRMLQHHGVEVFIAQNGTECLELLNEIEPTLIVTDLAMPTKDGWETLVAIRSNVATAHITVVALTAYHSADVALDAIKAGFDGYFPKPVNPATFINRLAEILAS